MQIYIAQKVLEILISDIGHVTYFDPLNHFKIKNHYNSELTSELLKSKT